MKRRLHVSVKQHNVSPQIIAMAIFFVFGSVVPLIVFFKYSTDPGLDFVPPAKTTNADTLLLRPKDVIRFNMHPHVVRFNKLRRNMVDQVGCGKTKLDRPATPNVSVRCRSIHAACSSNALIDRIDCPIGCRFATEGRLESFDAIEGEVADLQCPFDSFSFSMTMESSIYYPDTDCNQGKRDIYASPKRNCADVWMNYLSLESFGWVYEDPDQQHKREITWPKKKVPVVAFISNCIGSNNRMEYFQELFRYLEIDSYGSCLNNQNNVEITEKLSVIKQYKFTLAFENSSEEDFVTEKFFDALAVGSVPIHLGFKNIHKYAPSSKSILSVHDYASPQDLAEYVKFLDLNDAAYLEYHKWREGSILPSFHYLLQATTVHSACRFCIKVADLQRKIFGFYSTNNNTPREFSPEAPITIFWRERGFFWFHEAFLDNSLLGCFQQLIQTIQQTRKTLGLTERIHSIEDIWNNRKITDDSVLGDFIRSGNNEIDVTFIYNSFKIL